MASFSPSHPESYSDAHVQFVSSTGTSVLEILTMLITMSMLPLLSSLLIPWIYPPKLLKPAASVSSLYTLLQAVVEYPVIVIMPLWIVTALTHQDALTNTEDTTTPEETVGEGEWNYVVCVIIFCCCAGMMVVNYSITEPKWEGFVPLWNKVKKQPIATGMTLSKKTTKQSGSHNPKPSSTSQEKGDDEKSVPEKIKYPFVTNYRAIVIYVTVIAILAVDFPIFPRRYAKTKIYGHSLMDIGTGSFIFSNGIIAPEAKNRKSNLFKSWFSSIPLLFLGFARLISVKGLEYHEVVEEYGTQWNFFFTLASVKLLSAITYEIVNPALSIRLACIVGLGYEFLLVHNGFIESYILNSSQSRDNFIDANREGLFSVLGYLTIYFGSVYIGKVLSQVGSRSVGDWSVYLCRSGMHVVFLWIAFALGTKLGYPTCRRAANLNYSLWVLATNYTVLWVLTAISLVQAVVQQLGLLHGPLISYELDAAMREREKKVQELKKKCYERNFMKPHLRQAVTQLENKLKECQELRKSSPSALAQAEVTIKHLEEETDRILEQLKKEAGNSDSDDSDLEATKGNLISLPDLTKSPVTLEAICYNGLAIFLLGNILTGLVNWMVPTIYTPDYAALCYLWAYVTTISVISVALYYCQVQLKFW